MSAMPDPLAPTSEVQSILDCLFFPEAMDEELPSFDLTEEPAKKRTRSGSPSPSSSGLSTSGESSDEPSKALTRKERNRRHARETRLRKKEFVENLKTELAKVQTEKQALETKMAAQSEAAAAQHGHWLSTLNRVLELRGSGEPDEAQWRQVVCEEVVLVHPITPYRSYKSADVVSNRVVLLGIPDMINDSQSLHVALRGLCAQGLHSGQGTGSASKIQVDVRYHVNADEVHFSDSGIMVPFEMSTTNLALLGLRSEVTKRGSLRAAFGKDNRLRQLDMYFDPIAVWRQMQFARGKDDVSAVTPPNTLHAAMGPSQEARVITEASRPFKITHVNDAWVNLCGFTQEEAQGCTLRMLQGEDTDLATVNALVKDCQEGRPSSMEVVNYDKQGMKFKNFLQVYPLSDNNTEGDITHLLGVLTPLGDKFE